jgi:hypothetical protein
VDGMATNVHALCGASLSASNYSLNVLLLFVTRRVLQQDLI